jgi:TonB family protein
MKAKMEHISTRTEQAYQRNSFRVFTANVWDRLIAETRFRISGSLSFSIIVHVLFFLSYFSLSALDQSIEQPIQEISFIDMTEIVEKPKDVIKQKKSPPPRPRMTQTQPKEKPDNAKSSSPAPLALGGDRIFLDSPRKQAPINMKQTEPIANNVSQDMLKVSPAIGLKKDERISKPEALDLGKNRDRLIASASKEQGAVSFDQSDRSQIDLEPGRIETGATGAVTNDFGSDPPKPKVEKSESPLKPKETQTIITGALANREILKKVIPPFPRWAKIQGVSAQIALRFTVMENGVVKENVIIERTSGSLQWDQMVIAALKNWQFVPLAQKGVREDQTGVITFKFVI